MGDLSPHFNKSEFACRCGCGTEKVSPLLVAALEKLRMLAGLAIVIDRGASCAKHNAAVGGKPDSQHLESASAEGAAAADLKIPPLSLQSMYQLALGVPAFANGGIGVYDEKFLHVDVRGRKARWARVNGTYTSIEASGLIKA